MFSTLRTTLITASLALAAALPLSSLTTTMAQAAPARGGVPPFCLLPGSTNGPGGAPQICAYYDWQQCLQAGAERRANCVVNIDFPGQIVRSGDGWRAVGGR